MEHDKKRLGAAIRHAREEEMSPPLTQKQLAEAVHMDPRRIGAIERGQFERVRPANRDAIESVLGWEHGSWDRVLKGGEPARMERRPVERRRVEDGEDLIYVVTNVRAAGPDVQHTLRLILEKEIERSHKG